MYHQILDNLPDGLFTTDNEGRINYFNATAERIMGLPATDAMGMDCKDVFKGTICETDCPLRKAPHKEKNNNREFVITSADSRKVSIICSTFMLTDQEGKAIGRMGVFKDISDRRSREEDLRFSESKYRHVFEGSKDMILIISKDEMIKDVNQAGIDLLKYSSKQELLSLTSVENIFNNPLHWRVFRKQIDRHGFIKDFEAGFKKKEGPPIHCLLSGNAVRDKNGEIIGYEGIAKDITARMDDHKNLQQRHQELQVLTSVALAMNTSQDLDDILMTALKKVLKVLRLNVGGIFLIDHEEHLFSLSADQGLAENGLYKNNQILLHDELLMRSLLKKDLSLAPEPIFPPFMAHFQGKNKMKPVELTCFLITAKEKARGFLALDVPSNRDITEGQDFHLLGSLGNFLGGAIENSRLLQTIHQHREELKGLTARLFDSQEKERKRIARELHDEAGQALTGINFTLETIEKNLSPELNHVKELISDIKRQINRTYQEMRRISYRLHPAILIDLGLEPALDSYLADLSKHSDLEIDFKMVGFEKRLEPEIETALYRFSQEALTNTMKHSHAKHFKLSIIRSYPHIIFLAEDDGVGFDSGHFDKHPQALGLLGMRERVSIMGGNFSIRTSAGKGTRIRIEIPIRKSPHE